MNADVGIRNLEGKDFLNGMDSYLNLILSTGFTG